MKESAAQRSDGLVLLQVQGHASTTNYLGQVREGVGQCYTLSFFKFLYLI
jgi:hypothetical protein